MSPQEKTPGGGTQGLSQFGSDTDRPKRTRAKRLRRPNPRCTCASYGTCGLCRQIAERRIAAERRRWSGGAS